MLIPGPGAEALKRDMQHQPGHSEKLENKAGYQPRIVAEDFQRQQKVFVVDQIHAYRQDDRQRSRNQQLFCQFKQR